MIDNSIPVQKYEKCLFDIKAKMQGQLSKEQDIIWLKFYHCISQGFDNIEELPLMFALIHPDFYNKVGLSFRNSPILKMHSNNQFTSGIRSTDRCQVNLLTGYPCMYEKLNSREKVQADHFWPNSLGGPYVLDNRLLLCKYHNGMKSNSIHNYSWGKIPNWLKNQLFNLYLLKR